jgi:hypothetical protein
MGIYRVTDPIPVMVREDGTFVSRTLTEGTLISVEETSIDLNRYVIVNWNGRDTLMYGRELLTRAVRAFKYDD